MVLYYGITHYHFLCSVLHRLEFHAEERAVLCIPERINDSKKLQELFEASGFFDEIVLYGEYIPKPDEINEDTIQKTIHEVGEYIKENFPVDLKQCDEIYVFNDSYALGVYLAAEGMPYSYFEDGCGRLSTPDELKQHTAEVSVIRGALVDKLGLFGDNTAIRRRIGDLEHQVEGYHNDKDVHFSATEALKHLDKEKMAGILKIFGGKAISDQDKDYCMLITQHYINLNLMNYAEQKQLYTLLVDYFSDGLPLVVKPHPSDIHGLYQKWFPDATVLNRMCLTELLPYCGNIHYKTGICASSTSIYGLGEWMDETVCFTQEIEKTYRYMHQYYMALRCIAHLGVREGAKVYMMSGMNCEQFIGLNKHYHIIPDSMEKIDDYKQMANTAARRYVVIDDILKKGKKVDTCIEMLKMATSDDVLIFLNTKNKAFFVKERNLEVLKNIVPVAITVKEMQGGQQKREYVYIFSKNVRVREELMKMKEYKELKYTGVTVEVNQEEQTEVKVLEGINRALEARLNLVSNRYRQSKKELKIKCRESEEEIKSLRQENKKLKKYSLYGVKEAFLKK